VLADLLRRTAPEEVAPVVAWLSGELTQRQVGVGWAALKELPAPAGAPTLTVTDVEAALDALGSTGRAGLADPPPRGRWPRLLGAATGPEQAFLRALLSGGLRQGPRPG
jgi:DNA ligase-1